MLVLCLAHTARAQQINQFSFYIGKPPAQSIDGVLHTKSAKKKSINQICIICLYIIPIIPLKIKEIHKICSPRFNGLKYAP